MSDGTQTITLQELCYDSLSSAEREIFAEFFGIDSLAINFCVYTDLSFSMIGEEGKQYDLLIHTAGKTLSATTTIPHLVPIDSFSFRLPPGEGLANAYRELRGFLSDPPGISNFYRYFTKINDAPFLPGFTSVSHDLFFDGKSFEFPLPKGEPRNYDDDPNIFGLYTLGDTVVVKSANIDKAHHDFWNTLEFNAINQGPFSNATKIQSNINGGIGIWGGYTAGYYELVVK